MTTTPSVTVGANIRAEMARRGVSQQALAARVGLSQNGISRRLRGETPVDINELSLIASALDVALADLLAADVKAAS